MAIGLAAVALLVAAVLPPVAAASITVGSDLSGTLFGPSQPSNCAPIAPPCTNLLGGVHEGNAFPATSPTSGTVTAFNIKTGSAGTVTFRLGEVDRTVEANATATATGPTVALPGAGIYSFPASLPIGVGESPGFDSSMNTAAGACSNHGYYFL